MTTRESNSIIAELNRQRCLIQVLSAAIASLPKGTIDAALVRKQVHHARIFGKDIFQGPQGQETAEKMINQILG